MMKFKSKNDKGKNNLSGRELRRRCSSLSCPK